MTAHEEHVPEPAILQIRLRTGEWRKVDCYLTEAVPAPRTLDLCKTLSRLIRGGQERPELVHLRLSAEFYRWGHWFLRERRVRVCRYFEEAA